MAKEFSSKQTVYLEEDKSAYFIVKKNSLNVQAKLLNVEGNPEELAELIQTLVLDVKGVTIDGEEAKLEDVYNWPLDLVTEILQKILQAANKSADNSDLGAEEKN